MIRRIYHKLRKLPVLGPCLQWAAAVMRLLRHARRIFNAVVSSEGIVSNRVASQESATSGIWWELERQKLVGRYLAHILVLQEEKMSAAKSGPGESDRLGDHATVKNTADGEASARMN